MRFLLLCNKLTDGGAERVCVCWANGLIQRGHMVSIYADYNEGISYKLDDRVKLIQNRCVYTNSFFKRRWIYYHDLYELLDRDRYDVIISIMHYYTFSTWLIAKMHRSNTKILMTEHNAFDRPAFRALSKREYVEKFILNRLWDHVTVLTKADKDFIGDRIKKVTVLPNPLFGEPVKSVPLDKEPVVLAVGRLDVWQTKGFDLLINSWNTLSNKYPNWTLKIVGSSSGKSLEFLKSLVGPNTKVKFCPFTEDIQDEYRKAEVFVLSSRNEGFGLVLIEAMSQGCACIASDYKGRQAEIITNKFNGEIIHYDDIEGLTDSIERLITNVELRRKYQNNAIRSLERYKIDHVIDRLEELCSSMISNG